VTHQSRLIKDRHREAMIAQKQGVNLVRASPAAFLSKDIHVADCAFIHQDESVIQDALKRLTYVHRVDHTPEVDDWAVEELLFRLDHIEELSGQQITAIHRMNAWMALDHENTPETWG
jgi:hypothetical protein